MARTHRRVPIYSSLRCPTTKSELKAREAIDQEDLDELGVRLQSRVKKRHIITAYDDEPVASLNEFYPYRLWSRLFRNWIKRVSRQGYTRKEFLSRGPAGWYEWYQEYLRTKNNVS